MAELIIAPSAGPSGGGSTPTGTGLVHVTSGVQDGAALAASAASRLFGRGSAGGAGDFQEITVGSGLSMSGTTLSATGGGGGPTVNAMSADVTVNNSTTFVDATGLLVAIGASATEIWQFQAQILFQSASASSRWKIQFTVPSGATMAWGPDMQATATFYFSPVAVGASQATLIGAAAVFAFGSAASGLNAMNLYGWIFGGGTAGNVQLQFAQNSLHASNNTFKKGSVLFATKVAS